MGRAEQFARPFASPKTLVGDLPVVPEEAVPPKMGREMSVFGAENRSQLAKLKRTFGWECAPWRS